MMHVIVWPAAVKCAAVIPHDEVERPPAMPIHEARLGREGSQIVEKRTPVTHFETCNVRGMGTQI